MNFALFADDETKRVLKGVVHVDGSIRVQTVSQKNSMFLTALLRKVKEKTGYGVLLNTSFNDRGEPIVNTPADALKTFSNTDIEVLYLENYRVEKD